MSFWDAFSQMISRNAHNYPSLFIPTHRVDVGDGDAKPIKRGEAYCRVWLVEMQLAKGVEWFKTLYPVVHSAIRFDHGGTTVTIPQLSGPGFLSELAGDSLDRVIQCNYPLSPLFPYNRGLVELQAGLFSMVADDRIKRFITALERFSQLLPKPELSTVLHLASPVYNGIQDLLGAGKSGLQLGYQQTFTEAGGEGGNDLRPGYFVAILDEGGTIDKNRLCVVNDSLCIGLPGVNKEFIMDHQPLEGYSYMLFRLERRPDQDWESLSNIKGLVYHAQEAVSQGKYEEVRNSILPAIKVAIFRSPDVAKKDKMGMVLRIEAELSEWGLESTRGPVSKPSLYAIMQKPLPAVDPQKEAKMTALEALFGADV